MATRLILAALLSICSLCFSQECNEKLLENIDFPGTDIKFVFSPDSHYCQQLCTQHPSCLFFTFIRADWTTDNRHFYCYLKTTPSGRPNVQTPLQGVTSGYSLKSCTPDQKLCVPQVNENLDFPGADYESLFTPDYEECQRICTQDPACQFFTFVNGVFTPEKIRYKCHLKFSWTVPIPPLVERKTGVVSGFSHNLQLAAGSTQSFKPACDGKLFPNTDIPGSDIVNHPSASIGHCQALCNAQPDCTYFSFDSADLRCYLKSNKNEMVTRAKNGVTSGLPARLCEVDQQWVQVAHEGVDFRGSDIRFELMDDPGTCQQRCTDDPNCQFYTYVNQSFSDKVYRRRCYFKRVITMPAPPKVTKLANVVSGFNLRNCL